ncbi:MAG: GNAT family N-acetyltransferase [Thermoflexales bacterium]
MENTLSSDPPDVAGLRWRPITRDDLAALVALAAECYLTDGGLASMNEPDNLLNRYLRDEASSGIGAFAADASLVACVSVRVARDSETARAICVGQVLPALRDRGIGAYLLRWSEAKARTLFAAAAADKRVLQVATESLSGSADHLYRSRGFASVFEERVMRRSLDLPLPERVMPPGVTITSWQPALAELFFRAYEASFRDRPGFPWRTGVEWISVTADDDDFKPEWSLLAQAGGEPVGFLTADRGNLSGYVAQVGVTPGLRRRGLGSALVVEAMRRMREAGARVVHLTVNVNNPGAAQVYVNLGFDFVGRRARYERTADP